MEQISVASPFNVDVKMRQLKLEQKQKTREAQMMNNATRVVCESANGKSADLKKLKLEQQQKTQEAGEIRSQYRSGDETSAIDKSRLLRLMVSIRVGI